MNEKMPERVWIGFGHADASTHDGRDGSCTICPVPILHDHPGPEAGLEYIRADLYDQAIKERDEGAAMLRLCSARVEQYADAANRYVGPTLLGPPAYQGWLREHYEVMRLRKVLLPFLSRLAQKGAER